MSMPEYKLKLFTGTFAEVERDLHLWLASTAVEIIAASHTIQGHIEVKNHGWTPIIYYLILYKPL